MTIIFWLDVGASYPVYIQLMFLFNDSRLTNNFAIFFMFEKKKGFGNAEKIKNAFTVTKSTFNNRVDAFDF